MAVWCLGSINEDRVYRVPRIPAPGETLASRSMTVGLGGKGANMSVAAARAGAHVRHVGAIGEGAEWCVERLMEYGVDTRAILRLPGPAAHAVIAVDDAGENAIVLHPGANRAIPEDAMRAALAEAATGDWLLIQNETNLQVEGARLGRDLGLRVAYAAAPFESEAVQEVLPFLDLLLLNEVEAGQLARATGKAPDALGVPDVIVTLGARGAEWHGPQGRQGFDAVKVTPVDTTGAGDTFTGYVLAGLDRGMPMAQAIGLATRAAAIKVTRPGAADAIPDLAEVQEAR